MTESELLRTGPEWEAELKVSVMDPDGWRADGTPFETPITKTEFVRRAIPSTISCVDWEWLK